MSRLSEFFRIRFHRRKSLRNQTLVHLYKISGKMILLRQKYHFSRDFSLPLLRFLDPPSSSPGAGHRVTTAGDPPTGAVGPGLGARGMVSAALKRYRRWAGVVEDAE